MKKSYVFVNVKLIDNKNRKVIIRRGLWIKKICLPRVDLSFFVYFLRLTNQKVNLLDAGICNIDKLVTSFCLRAFNLLTRDRFCDLYKPLSTSFSLPPSLSLRCNTQVSFLFYSQDCITLPLLDVDSISFLRLPCQYYSSATDPIKFRLTSANLPLCCCSSNTLSTTQASRPRLLPAFKQLQ